MKYLDYALIVLIIIASIGAVFVYTLNRDSSTDGVACTMDALICPDGTAVGRTGPDCSFPPCPELGVPDDIQSHIDSKADLIRLTTPLPGARITSPVTLQGEARGYWFFEASFPVTVVDWDGRIIGNGIATADGEWMTENFVPFTATVTFTVDPETPYRRGALILQKDNPSGLPENDNALEIPVTF